MREVVGSKPKKKKTVGFSSRLDEEWLDVLRQEAENQGISVNSLINKILKDYSKHSRWVERLGMITITRQTMSKIVTCCPEEELKETAKISGTINAKDMFRTMDIAPTFDNLMDFLKTNPGKYGNWFKVNEYNRDRKVVIHLHHDLGKSWSIFIAKQVSSMIEELLGKTTTTEVFDNFATIKITM
jgi:hypothetical protein